MEISGVFTICICRLCEGGKVICEGEVMCNLKGEVMCWGEVMCEGDK